MHIHDRNSIDADFSLPRRAEMQSFKRIHTLAILHTPIIIQTCLELGFIFELLLKTHFRKIYTLALIVTKLANGSFGVPCSWSSRKNMAEYKLYNFTQQEFPSRFCIEPRSDIDFFDLLSSPCNQLD
ncbi:hypothetical protein RF11_08625 [Thelohanellus kitauei]|uniref:Uncharacterized protein n=1 Tax=Thelohanellus kitauei TaxID=669202 RepID=A0A0C2MR84_THEKT|nr:hypothetical protein RF11_08625 [Thelohanellus kitauei]